MCGMDAKKTETWTELRAPTWRSFVRLSLIVTLALAVCCESVLVTYAYADTGSSRRPADPGPSIPAAFAQQTLIWEDCGDGAKCTKVKAPMDWKHPNDGDTVELAVKKYPATGPIEGAHEAVFLNPGGPGSSGIGFLDRNRNTIPQDLRDSFDFVSWDPRGVGASTPVKCLSARDLDLALTFWADPTTDDGIAKRREMAKTIGDTCRKNGGKLIEHVGTVETVSDLNLLRQLLGQSKLNYIGLSYGTRLGAAFTDAYPSKVGRMVFDGSVDPSLTQYEHDMAQMRGFEKAVNRYVTEHCNNWICPLWSEEDPDPSDPEPRKQRLRDFLDKLGKNPLPTDDPDRPLTVTAAYYGMIVTMYSDDWYWMGEGLTQAMKKGEGHLLQDLADGYSGRRRDGTYANNSMQAYWAITCSDLDRYGAEEGRKMAETFKKEGGTLGTVMGGMENMCEFWPGKESGSKPVKRYTGRDPLLMVASMGDVVTPLDWTRGLQRQLGRKAHLLLVDSDTHTSFPGNKCVDDSVTAYLLRGTVPKPGEMCTN